jgi:glutamyl/glutaminyl-tRNA synthetase
MLDTNDEDLWQLMGERVHALVPDNQKALFVAAVKPVIQSADEALFWAECLCTDKLEHDDEGHLVVCEAGHDFYQAACEALDAHGVDYDYFINHIREKTGACDHNLYMPVRIALTGMLHGPELDKILKLVGVAQARIRFEQVMDLCHCH